MSGSGGTNFRTRCRPDKNHFRFRSVSVQCLHPRACHVTTRAPYRMTGVSISSDEFTRNPCLFADLPLPPPGGGGGERRSGGKSLSVASSSATAVRSICLLMKALSHVLAFRAATANATCWISSDFDTSVTSYVITDTIQLSFFSRLRVLVITRRKSLN